MNIFRGKRVALIGPAPHTAHYDQFKKINGYDVVVRINLALPIPPAVRDCTTARCDVLYARRKVYPTSDWKHVQQVRIEPKTLWEGDFQRDFAIYEPWKDKIIFLSPFFLKGGWISELGSNPNMGMVAISDILDHQPRELYITGITFYQGKPYNADYAARVPVETLAGMTNHKGTVFGHDQAAQIQFFRQHFAARVKMDEALARIVQEF